MTPHISAQKGEICKKVIMTGDPLRANHIANTYLNDCKVVSEVRGNHIHTGKTADGLEVSVMASGMGMASLGIYAEELYRFYEVDEIIRVGTMGSYQKSIPVGDSVVAISSSTDSNRNRFQFQNMDYPPTAGTDMLYRSMKGYYHDPQVHFGVIHSTDSFYQEENESNVQSLARGGILGVEMETACLYTTAKRYGKEALSILLVVDSLVDPDAYFMNPKERETKIEKNTSIALSVFKG